MIVGGAGLLGGLFLPFFGGDNPFSRIFETAVEFLIAFHVLPAVLVIAAGVVGLAASGLKQAAAGVGMSIGLTHLSIWIVYRIDWQGSGSPGVGWWVLLAGAALSLAGGLILLVQSQQSTGRRTAP